MPYIVKKNKFKYRNPTTGNYEGVDVVAEQDFADYRDELEAVGNSQETRVTNAGTAQVNAVNAAGTAAVANFPVTADATDTLAADFAATYVPNQAYNVGDFCTYQYKLYTCKTAIAENADSTFVAAHWTQVNISDTLTNQVGDLNAQVGDLKKDLYLDLNNENMWTNGSITSSTGSNTTNGSDYTIRTNAIPNDVSKIMMLNAVDYKYLVFAYTSETVFGTNTYVGWWTGSEFSKSSPPTDWVLTATNLDDARAAAKLLSPSVDPIYFRVEIRTRSNSGNIGASACNALLFGDLKLIQLDSTLTQEGMAADAKVTGDEIANLKTQTEEIDETIFIGESERNITTRTGVALPQASTSIKIDEALSTQKTYKIIIDFSAVPSKLSSIQTAVSTSASTVIDTIHSGSIGGRQRLEIEHTPTASGAEYIRINFVSSYTGDLTADLVVDEINIPLETSFYTKPQIDTRIKPANRFNINTATFNAAISSTTGEVAASTIRRAASDYIDVTGHTSITFSQRAFTYAFYNSNKTFISDSGGSMSAAGTLNIPSGASYIRFTASVNDINDLIAYFDGETTSETQYGYTSTVVGANIDKALADSINRNRYMHDDNIIDRSAIVSIGSGSAYFDYVYHGDAQRSLKVICNNTVTQARIYISIPQVIAMNGVYAFKIKAYVSGASNITGIILYATPGSAAISGGISIEIDINNLKNGWNTLFAYTYKAALLTAWADYQYFTVEVNTNGDAEINFAEIIPQRSEKAKLIVTDDHAYQEFLTYAYPTLKSLGIPVTWGVKWGILGNDVEWGHILSEEQITTLADDPYSEFSFHSWNGGVQSEWSDARNREDMQKCITAMKRHNVMPLHLWRSAWVQNNGGPNVGGIYDMLEGSAYYDNTAGKMLSIPFPDIYNISRIQLHSSVRDQAWFDGFFDRLKKTHCTAVVYTHSIVANDSAYAANNMTQDQLAMFLSGCTTGVNEGWLEGTTFSWEMTKYYAEQYRSQLLS